LDDVTQNLFVETIVRLLGMRNLETEEHSRRVAKLTVNLATACGVSKQQQINLWRGAMLHDIGKIGIPDAILLKKDPLTEEDHEIIRRHLVIAYEMLRKIPYLHTVLDIPYCHHEKWDGTGYPRGLKGKGIPLAARIFTVVDVWDAMLSERHYRSAWKLGDVKMHMLKQTGRHFDPQIIKIFLGANKARWNINLELMPGNRQTI
jgi:putative two-component system response regulator